MTLPFSSGDREHKKFVDEHQPSVRVKLTAATVKKTITGESATFAAGAAGTTGVISLAYAPIFGASGGIMGSLGDTSFAWVTGTVLTTEVIWRDDMTQAAQLTALTNGQFAINYDTGEIRYKKATSGTSDTCNYTTRVLAKEA